MLLKVYEKVGRRCCERLCDGLIKLLEIGRHAAVFYFYICARLVYDRNHYFGFGPIPKPKLKLADTFARYRNRHQNYNLKQI